MEAGRRKTSVAAVALVALLVVAAAATTADAAGLCNLDQAAVEPCRSYCMVGSTEDSPTPECCAAMGQADFQCLCDNMGVLRWFAKRQSISVDRAMKIPSKCNIPNAPTKCTKAN